MEKFKTLKYQKFEVEKKKKKSKFVLKSKEVGLKIHYQKSVAKI